MLILLGNDNIYNADHAVTEEHEQNEILIQLRKKRNLTQKDMADNLNIAQSTYSGYESGYRSPDIETLKKIACFFNVSIDYLLGNEDPVNYENTKKEIIEELGDGVQLRFEDWKSITPEKIKYIKAILKADDENNNK